MSRNTGLLSKFSYKINTLKRSTSTYRNTSPSPVPAKRNSLVFPENAEESEESEDSVTESFADLSMETHATKDYNAMINHIEEHYRFSAKVTPRDRREIQTSLPAWQSWQNTVRAAAQS